MIDLNNICEELIKIVEHYEKSAPVVSNFANNVYIRLNKGEGVFITEILSLKRLKEENEFINANFAQNEIYHCIKRHNFNVEGLLGY